MQAKTFFDLLYFKTGANLRTEISRYYLNYCWWVIEPVSTMAVFYVVFGIFLNSGIENFVGFLLCNLTWWNWFARTVPNASTSIYNARELMLQVDVPKIFFPLEIFLRDSFKQLFVVILLLIFLVFYTTPVTIAWTALPVVVCVEILLIIGVSTLCAAAVPFVPDLEFVIRTMIDLLLFASGVFYRIEDVVKPEHRAIMYLNPLAGLIKNYRTILLHGQWPDWQYLGEVAVFSLLLCLISFWLIKKLDRIYPRVCNQ